MDLFIFKSLIRKRLLLHSVFWVVYYFLSSLIFLGLPGGFYPLFLTHLFYTCNALFLIYSTNYIFYGVLVKKPILIPLGIVYIVGTIFFYSSISAYTYNSILRPAIGGELATWMNWIAYACFLCFFGMSIKFSRTIYLKLIEELEQKENLLHIKEHFLRTQVHPHFLFNTLNNLYGLSLSGDSRLPKLMLRLANILRHQIYDIEKKYVPLKNEVKYIINYIELEKIRYGTNLEFTFEKPENIGQNWYIAPSLLIVFFENAFKHSQSFTNENIKIWGQLYFGKDETIHFVLNNTFITSKNETGKYTGQGLTNVKKRLDIDYPNRHTLTIVKEANVFSVSLTIKNQIHERTDY